MPEVDRVRALTDAAQDGSLEEPADLAVSGNDHADHDDGKGVEEQEPAPIKARRVFALVEEHPDHDRERDRRGRIGAPPRWSAPHPSGRTPAVTTSALCPAVEDEHGQGPHRRAEEKSHAVGVGAEVNPGGVGLVRDVVADRDDGHRDRRRGGQQERQHDHAIDTDGASFVALPGDSRHQQDQSRPQQVVLLFDRQ